MRNIKKLLEDFEDYEFEELKAEVSNLTDENAHCEAVLTIAQKYMPEYVEKFQKFVDLRDSKNGLDTKDVQERYKLTKQMFKELADKIGNLKAKELYMCL